MSARASNAARRGALRGVLLGLTVFAVTGRSFADETKTVLRTEPSAEQRGADAYDRAIDAYGKGDKQSALRFMAEAYSISPHVELVYDMAKLEKELGRCRDALQHYRQYLKEASGGVMTPAASSSVRELEARCGTDAPKAHADPMKIVGWSAIGAGVAAGVAGIYFAIAGQGAADDAQRILRTDEQLGKSWDSGDQRVRDGQRDNTVATVCLATAGTLITGGTLLLLFGSKIASRHEETVTVGTVHGGSVVTYTRGF
ncbi:MAG TPA: hypothetical protein VHC69_30985 [Polyangiaceae bacterium]|nr:hypothetical protein [Polyangiaceae bacterium]